MNGFFWRPVGPGPGKMTPTDPALVVDWTGNAAGDIFGLQLHDPASR